MEKFIHLGLVLYHLSLRFSLSAHPVVYDNFSKEKYKKEGKFLIIFYAVDKILLDIHNTHTNACNRGTNRRNLFVQFLCAETKGALLWLPRKIISTTSHKDVMNSSKCPLKHEKLLRLRDEGFHLTMVQSAWKNYKQVTIWEGFESLPEK